MTTNKLTTQELLYKYTISLLLKSLARRRYLHTTLKVKDQTALKEEDRVHTLYLILAFLNKLFIFDLIAIFTFNSLTILAIIFLLNLIIYKLFLDFTEGEYLNIAQEMLKNRGENIYFKEDLIYRITPLRLSEYANTLANFLRDSASQTRSTNFEEDVTKSFKVVHKQLIKSNNFRNIIEEIEEYIGTGSIVEVSLSDKFKNNKTKSINDEYVRLMRVIPQMQMNSAVYSENGKFFFDASSIISDNDEEQRQYFDMLRSLYTPYFAEFKEDMRALEEEQLKLTENERKNAEKQEIINYVERYNLPEEALSILTKINKNKDKWQFYYWNQNTEGITGNKDYLSIKCKMLNNQNIDNITKLKAEIESVIGKKVIIQSDINDANSFTLLVMFKQAIAQFKLSAKELMEYTNQNKLFIGRGLTGDITVDFDDNAYHSLTGGGSGSGKSVDLQADIFQMLTLKDYKYQHAVIISGGKLADFQNMGLANKKALMLNAGENLDSIGRTVLTEEQSIEKIYEYIKMLEWELNRRENLFLNNQVANLGEYNKKFPQKSMGRILFVADEWESLRRIAKRYKNAETKKDYDDLIMMSVSNLFSKGRSGGLNIKVATQDFTADTVGVIRRQFTAMKLGVGDKNTYSSYNGQALASYFAEMTRTGQKTEGTFFMQSAKMKFNTPPVEFSNNFSMLRTPYVDASDLRKAIQTNVKDFETDKLYQEYKNLFTEKNKSEGVNKPKKSNEIDLNLIN